MRKFYVHKEDHLNRYLLCEISRWENRRGRTPQEALKREIDEEMHCSVQIGEQIDYTAYEYDFGIVHLKTFYCKLVEGSPVLTEHVAIKWLYPNELAALEWAPADIPTIEKLSKESIVK